MSPNPPVVVYDLVIVGSGIAGQAAARGDGTGTGGQNL